MDKLSRLLLVLACLGLVERRPLVIFAQQYYEEQGDADDDCAGGSCPAPDNIRGGGGQEEATKQQQQQQQQQEPSCRVWLGPSPIKQAEEHGFGLGLFVGTFIKQGTLLEPTLFGSEILLPIYGSETIYNYHPPLREYIWDEDLLPEVAVEDPSQLTALFMPGLAAIAPCTSNNYNLKLDPNSGASMTETPHRQSTTAGSFTYRQSVSYVAVRDIFPGEELTVECSDDSFDGGAYYLSRFAAHNDTTICLDNVRVQPSSMNDDNLDVGNGLFAQTDIAAGATIVSSPVLPVHQQEMDISNHDDQQQPNNLKINKKQLMLNYCYGHPQSDLLLLPYGPMIHALNHAPTTTRNDNSATTTANAKLQWHAMDTTHLDRRQQHHLEALLHLPAPKVATTHGATLTVDVVATRAIARGEEIFLDYGTEWSEAWQRHVHDHPTARDTTSTFRSAAQFRAQQRETIIRTQDEQEANPYPINLETFCYYQPRPGTEETDPLYVEWDDDDDAGCFRPCTVHTRHRDTSTKNTYTVRLYQDDNPRILETCLIDSDYIVWNVPESAIRLVDRPYTSHVFMETAFRHFIGVLDLYPEAWKRQTLRRSHTVGNGEEFKRKLSTPLAKKNQ